MATPGGSARGTARQERHGTTGGNSGDGEGRGRPPPTPPARSFNYRRVPPATIRSPLRNDLLDAATRVCRDIGEARLIAGSTGVTLALSGSGPSLVCGAASGSAAL